MEVGDQPALFHVSPGQILVPAHLVISVGFSEVPGAGATLESSDAAAVAVASSAGTLFSTSSMGSVAVVSAAAVVAAAFSVLNVAIFFRWWVGDSAICLLADGTKFNAR